MTSMPEVVGKSEPRVLLTSKKKTKRPCDACRRKKGVQFPRSSSSTPTPELIDAIPLQFDVSV